MATKRLIDANDLRVQFDDIPPYIGLAGSLVQQYIDNAPTVDAVEVPCRCCDCYYLLSGKNSLGLYFFCGHQNGLKNLRNTEKDFCIYAKKRDGDGNE